MQRAPQRQAQGTAPSVPAICRRAIVVCLALAGLFGITRAAEPGSEEGDLRPALVLEEDALARLDLERAAQLGRDGQWVPAVRALQQVLDGAAEKVVSQGRVYVSLREVVNRTLQGMGPEALRAYRLLYDADAARLIDRGLADRDAGPLEEAVRRFESSSRTPDALRALAALAMDRGRWTDALDWLDQLDRRTPSDIADPGAAAMRVCCYVRVGAVSRAREIVARLEKGRPVPVTLGGKETSLGRYLAALVAEYGEAGPVAPAPDAWPQTGGDAARDQPMPDCDVSAAIHLDAALPPAPRTPATLSLAGALLSQPVPTGSLVADSQRLIVRTDGRLCALDGYSGASRWGPFDEPAGPGPTGVHAGIMGALAEARAFWLRYGNFCTAGPCLVGGRVYDVEPEFPRYSAEEKGGGVRVSMRLGGVLVCREGASGRVLWQAGAVASGGGAHVPGVQFLAGPAWWEGRLYLPAGRENALELVCLDAATGALRFERRLAGFEMPGGEEEGGGEFDVFERLVPPVSAGGGVVAVSSDKGLVFICSALTGHIRWMAAYPRRGPDLTMEEAALPVPGFLAGEGFLPGPPVLVGGLCVAAPSDSDAVIGVDLETRATRWTAPRGQSLGIAGVAGDLLILDGPVVRALRAADGREVWSSARPGGVYGRSAVTAKAVYCPERDGVARLDVRTGAPAGVIRYGPGFSPDAGVNLFSLPGRLVLVGPAGVRILLDTAAADAEAARVEKEEPGAWRADWLRGRAAAAAGRFPEARARLAAALKAAEAAHSAEGVRQSKDALVETLLACAAKEGDPGPIREAMPMVEGRPDRVAELLARTVRILAAQGDGDRLADFLMTLPARAREAGILTSDCASAFMSDMSIALLEAETLRPGLLDVFRRRADAALSAAEGDAAGEFLRVFDDPSLVGTVRLARARALAKTDPDAALAALRRALLLSRPADLGRGLDEFATLCRRRGRTVLLCATARSLLAMRGLEPGAAGALQKLASECPQTSAPALEVSGALKETWHRDEYPVLASDPAEGPMTLALDEQGILLRGLAPAGGAVAWELPLPAGVESKDLGRLYERARSYLRLFPAQGCEEGDRFALLTPWAFYGLSAGAQYRVVWQHVFDVSVHQWPDAAMLAMRRIERPGGLALELVRGHDAWGECAGRLWRLVPGTGLILLDALTGQRVLEEPGPGREALAAAPASAGEWVVVPFDDGRIGLISADDGRRFEFVIEGPITGRPVSDGVERLWVPTAQGFAVFGLAPLRRLPTVRIRGGGQAVLDAGLGMAVVRLFSGKLAAIDAAGQRVRILREYAAEEGTCALDALLAGGDLFVLEVSGSTAVTSWLQMGGNVSWGELRLRRISLEGDAKEWAAVLSEGSYGIPGRLALLGDTVAAVWTEFDRAQDRYVCSARLIARASGKPVAELSTLETQWAPLRRFTGTALIPAAKGLILMTETGPVGFGPGSAEPDVKGPRAP